MEAGYHNSDVENVTINMKEQRSSESSSSSDLLDDSHDQSGSDSECESEQHKIIEALEFELSQNTSDYDAHVRYINLLRKVGDVDKLRQARKTMSTIFPLTAEMWKEWANDEIFLSSGSDSFLAVEKLYERGLSDYVTVALWCEYLHYVKENDPSVCNYSGDGISKARNLFEHAIAAVGLHVTEGSKIWEAYREFEHAILLRIDATDTKARDLQVERIRSLFQRQLSVPLVGMIDTINAYKAWEEEQGKVQLGDSNDLYALPSLVTAAYQKAVEMLNSRLKYEDLISRQEISDSEKLKSFLEYLQFEKSAGDPSRVHVLFERAITELPVSTDLWMEYMNFLDKTLKANSMLKDAHCRATRNCPWFGALWNQRLLSLERCHASEQEISAVYEMSLQCTFSTVEEYLDLFLTRIDGLRRRLSGDKTNCSVDYTLIRDTFQFAYDFLSSQQGITNKLLHFFTYWTHLELKLGKDLTSARGIWEKFLKASGSFLEAWQAYIAMEIGLGNISEARSIYKRCYCRRFPGTGSEDICHLWIQFEREYGTLDDFDFAVEKVAPRLEELQSYRAQQEAKTLPIPANNQHDSFMKRSVPKRKNSVVAGKAAKKQKKTGLQAQNKNNSKQQIDSYDVSSTQKQEEDVSHSGPARYTDQCTAFISNLNTKTTYEDLRKFFSDTGGVASIRILRDKFTGKSRGLAYVDFWDDEHLLAAVAKNKQMLLGKKLSIARSNPKKGRNTGSSFLAKQGAADKKDAAAAAKESTTMKAKAREDSQMTDQAQDRIPVTGKNTFAVPRSVKPLGWVTSAPKIEKEEDQRPKSNDEFRKLFIQK